MELKSDFDIAHMSLKRLKFVMVYIKMLVYINKFRVVYLIFIKSKYWKFYFLNLYARVLLTIISRKISNFSFLNTDFQLYFVGITLQTTICFILSFFISSLKAIMLSIDNSFHGKRFLKSFKSWSCKQLLKYNLYIVLHIANCELLF